MKFHTSNLGAYIFQNFVLYLGKFMDIFVILQLFGIKFLEMSQVSTALCHFPVVIMKFLRSEKYASWGQQILLYL